jgi:hypothetical protein
MNRSYTMFSVVLMLLTFCAGCVGNDGVYHIEWNSGEQFGAPMGRLAAGGTVEFILEETTDGFWSDAPVTGFRRIDRAWTEDPDVAVVSRINETIEGDEVNGFFTVRTKRPGKTRLVVLSASGDGRATINLHVSKAVKLKFGKARCLNLSTPYLVGMGVNLQHSLYDDDMVRLDGSIGELPFTIEPAEALNERYNAQQPGEVTLRSKVDETVREFRIVEAADVSDLTLDPIESWNPSNASVGGRWPEFEVHGLTNGSILCGEPNLVRHFEFEFETFTPEICHPQNHSIQFSPRKPGTCTFRISLPDVNQGEGWTIERSFELIQSDGSQTGDQ